MKRTYWRDCKAWIDAGLPLSTSSNEACKLFDACVSQGTGFYDEPTVGGLDKCTKAMLEADPAFVMGHIFSNYLNLGGSEKPLHLNPDIQQEIEQVNSLAEKSQLNERELKHLRALNLFARGKRYSAIQVWEDILVEYPTDLLASRQAFLGLINTGKSAENKDITTRTLTGYTKDTPGYSTILGWHAFNLEENNHFDLAEKTAKQCLEFDPYETYAAHSLAHTYLERGQHQKGIDFMYSTEKDWSPSNHFACHNYWHISLLYAEKGEFEEALGIFDQQIGPRTKKSKSDFNLTDGAALLYRLHMEGVDVGDRWKVLQDTCDVYIHEHGSIFIEGNLMFTSCHSDDREKRNAQLQSLKQYGRDDSEDWDNKHIVAEVGIPLCEGIVAFEDGNFSTAVDLLYPIRYEIARVGGSRAQRDVYQQLLIHAALKSHKQAHNKLGRMLLAERSVDKEKDPWSERLMAEFIATHNT